MAIDYESALYWKERTLQLVLALDKVRDSQDDDGDPQPMFEAMVRVLKDQFAADACAILVVTETTDDIDYVATVGFVADEVEPLCRRALERTGTGAVESDKWQHTLGIQVILKDYPLAGVVIARNSEPFTVQEIGMLSVAESQIDSAVIQARLIAKIIQRNRELEAIYQIDRLRDETDNETTLIAGFAGIALEHFHADLAILIHGDSQAGRHVMRTRMEQGVSVETLNAIHVQSADIDIPQVIPTPDELPDLTLLAAPFVVAGKRYGAVVIGRQTPFTIADHRLLYAMMSQMDTAIARSRNVHS